MDRGEDDQGRPAGQRRSLISEHHFRVLDHGVVLRGPSELTAGIAAAYRRFEGEAGAGAATVRFAPPVIEVDGAEVPLAPGLDPGMQLYNRFLGAVLDGIERCAVLHAAAVGGSAGALLLAAPSGAGKSSLTLGLVERGLALLSDDYAPLELASAEVHPYPRAISMRPGATGEWSPALRQALRDPQAPRLLDKVLLDPGQVFGEDAIARAPAPLRHVVLLTHDPGADAPTDAPYELDLAVAERCFDAFHHGLAGLGGVVATEVGRGAGVVAWRLTVDPAGGATAGLTALLADPAVLFSQRRFPVDARFEGRPELEPIGRREAATRLGREMVNRRPGGRLLRRYGGDATRLFVELAASLRRADCWRLRVGSFEATCDRLAGLAAD